LCEEKPRLQALAKGGQGRELEFACEIHPFQRRFRAVTAGLPPERNMTELLSRFADPGGTPSLSEVRAVREELPEDLVNGFVKAGTLTADELDRLGISQSTGHFGRLSADQSDRLVRVVRVVNEAIDTFANKEKALRWLRNPADVLDGQTPLELLYTDKGARTVETLLRRIAHGIAA
jgi:putative toxin-antitoxin system antitoxin component (TIGR02293 family)